MDKITENVDIWRRKKQLNRIIELAHNQTYPITLIPSMMTIREQALLYNIANSYFCGAGSIVDAGHFLGASTYSFGLGLETNSSINYLDNNKNKYIYSYDLGLWWDSWTELAKSGKWLPYFDRFPECYNLKSFDSFIPVFKKACTQYLPIIDIHTGDIRPLLAKEGFSNSIEVLFLDICKLPSLNHMVSKTFFPKLIPNKSVLIQQDFLNDWLPWIHVTMGYLSDYFDFIGSVASSAVYLCIKPIPEALFEKDIYWSLSFSEKEHYFDRALEIGLTSEEKDGCGLVKAVLYNDFGFLELAEDLIEQYQSNNNNAEEKVRYLKIGMNWNRDNDKW